MKYLSILVLTLSLQGCYQMVDQSDIHKAIKLCGTLENIQSIYAWSGGDENFKCIKPLEEIK